MTARRWLLEANDPERRLNNARPHRADHHCRQPITALTTVAVFIIPTGALAVGPIMLTTVENTILMHKAHDAELLAVTDKTVNTLIMHKF